MFIGAINPDMRSQLQSLAQEMTDLPVFVGCSGNFTVERVLSKNNITNITSNDVSMYSSAIGNCLIRKKMHIGVKLNEFAWLEQYLTDAESQVATLMLCGEYFKFVLSDLPYYKRQAAAYRAQFDNLHKKTVLRVKDRLSALTIKNYFCGDVLDYIETVPEQAVFLSYPPTISCAYERLYKKIDLIFEWDAPRYSIFDDESLKRLFEKAVQKKQWLIGSNKDLQQYEEFLIAEFQPTMNTQPFKIYSNIKTRCRVTKPQRAYDPVPLERATDTLSGDIKLVRLTSSQLNTLRSVYMSRAVAWTATPDIIIGICDGDKLFGVLAFKKVGAHYREFADLYMVTDFCIAPSVYKRLSKLILCIALSTEVQKIAEAEFQYPVKKIFTTVFTEKSVSMKYRGLFELFNRKEDGSAVNYVANAGRWTLKEAFQFWKDKYAGC